MYDTIIETLEDKLDHKYYPLTFGMIRDKLSDKYGWMCIQLEMNNYNEEKG